MLFGEHAVLHGRLCLVCAIRQRIRVELTPVTGTGFSIQSALGEYKADLKNIADSRDFRFVLGVVHKKAERVPSGFHLAIESDFPPTIGFGSSAAVTVAVAAALAQWTCNTVDPDALFRSARDTIREVQGLGSGADVAASVYGGIVMYRAEPLEVEKLPHVHPLTAVYSGSKKPTPEVVRHVEALRQEFPVVYNEIFDVMDQCAMNAADAAAMRDWRTFGRMMNIAQGQMDSLGVNNATLSEIVYALRADPGILGSKISGSGLGDCAIGLGAVSRQEFPFEAWPVEMDEQGARVEQS